MSGALEFLLRLQEECGGAISVERYMQEALYHPEFGYYTRHIRTVGRRGDFATSASLGEALGAGIARWLRSNRLPGARWHAIEIGAGTGELARTILRRLGLWGRRGLTYHIVETSPVLREEQRQAMPQFHMAWHESMASALADCEGRALIFSNELIDAFPCRVFEYCNGNWIEIGVHIEGGRVVECTLPRRPALSTSLPLDSLEGQRAEVHATAAEWIASWAGSVQEARMLTIDYGDTMPALYHRRPRGTLRAYFHHQRFEGLEVYHRFGKQDLTADVNFTDLRDWSERCGWHTLALSTQAEFLACHGARRAGLHDAQLAEHTGAGAAFKVLIQEMTSLATVYRSTRQNGLPSS